MGVSGLSPYKDKVKDREWHREYMRNKRKKRVVTPSDIKELHPSKAIPKTDADGNIIYEE